MKFDFSTRLRLPELHHFKVVAKLEMGCLNRG
jgi:hypothetical protein